MQLNPIVQGKENKIFTSTTQIYELVLLNNEVFDGGLMINTYDFKYD